MEKLSTHANIQNSECKWSSCHMYCEIFGSSYLGENLATCQRMTKYISISLEKEQTSPFWSRIRPAVMRSEERLGFQWRWDAGWRVLWLENSKDLSNLFKKMTIWNLSDYKAIFIVFSYTYSYIIYFLLFLLFIIIFLYYLYFLINTFLLVYVIYFFNISVYILYVVYISFTYSYT